MKRKSSAQLIQRSSIAADEIERFSSHAAGWWDPRGPLAALHRLNPSRLAYVRDCIAAHAGRDAAKPQPLRGLSVLDVGCGGGLMCEPLARMGAHVTGLDASGEAIAEARRHAEGQELEMSYIAGSAEELARGKGRYDVVTALEIVEHVADLDSLMAALADLLKPRGLLILSTVNRTPQSFLLGIVAAEYVLRWVPRGTHNWRKFLRPSELVRRLDANGLEPSDLTGLVYDPLADEFRLSRDRLDINYFLTAVKR